MLNRLTESLDFQAQALTLRSERQRLIAGNIANADTPGYQARDFDFARALREATVQQSGPSSSTGGGMAGSASPHHVAHIPLATGATAEPNLLYARPMQTNLDSNTVDMDQQRAAFADNAVKYEATLRFINSSSRTMLDAMKSHTQG